MIREQAQKLYKTVNTFFITCIDEDGYPLTKAVVPGKYRDNLSEIYFCTNSSSKFTAATRANSKASVYFFSRKLFWKGCMLKGDMEIVSDMTIKEKYWQNAFKNAYPQKSFNDPDFCVLKFVSTSGRFYSHFRPKDFDI